MTIEGVLRASRAAASRLTLYGNLVVRREGVLDYGRPNDRVLVPASIRWFLNESLYVGGVGMEVLDTDVGLWATDQAQVWIHGQYRDTWSPLVETASAGTATIRVNADYARGWQVGDLLLLTQTNSRDTEALRRQDERRRIAAVLGPGVFTLDQPLQFTHHVMTVPWTDAWGDRWTEVLAGKVANLTSNIRFEAGDPNHRPHILFMHHAKHYVEDLEIWSFSPAPKFTGVIETRGGSVNAPMGRYAWHNHIQDGGSRGSYLRRARIYDGIGDGIHLHESWGIEITDLVVYNQARFAMRDPRYGLFKADAPIMFEKSLISRYRLPNGLDDEQGHACDDCWMDRPLVANWGLEDAYFSHGLWTTGARNAAVVGAVMCGGSGSSQSSGIHWIAGGGSGGTEQVYVLRAEANSIRSMGFHSWQNNTPRQPIVDLLAWHNDIGLGWGAYGTNYWAFQVRAIGNNVQLSHVAAGWGITGFLADGLRRPGAIGIQIGAYGATTTTDAVYEDGVVRNVAENLRHERSGDAGRVSLVQFARVTWDSLRRIWFGGWSPPPPGSYVRVRQQQGLPRPANFTLYRLDDPNAPPGAVVDTEYNARRVDNDAAGTRPQTPRVRLTAPTEDSVETGMITLVAETTGTSVRFYQANRLLATVPVVGGRATFSFDMSQHPYRRAYFWAHATGANGAVNASRIVRVRKF